ncbi:MAG: class I SAM-dependent methyltransferase [Acidimicrobiia bacterium]
MRRPATAPATIPPFAAPRLRSAGGTTIELDLDRWRSEPDDVESGLLDELGDPVLDIGCGPGRLVAALAQRGRRALGIDPAAVAVAEAHRRGAPALCRSVFAPLPGEGRWAAALLLDGNIGIGGDPAALLRRVRRLLAPDGVGLVEVEPAGRASGPLVVRIETGAGAGPWFDWATVSCDDIDTVARAAGLRAGAVEARGGRWFAWLRQR